MILLLATISISMECFLQLTNLNMSKLLGSHGGRNVDSTNQMLKKHSKKSASDKFVMVIPPPNVTGSLHLGHALTTAIEDTITRWHRMKGKITLWVPGTDHAGIATQSVVEKRLKKLDGTTRHELGRTEFVKKVWEWKQTYGNKITSQIRFLGASVDWSREAFTMDSNLSRAVTEAFVRFYEDGLLYRDTRLINWSCALQSAISEIEVDYVDLEGRTFLAVPNHKQQEKYEFGMITSFAYKVEASPSEEIVVATTRLETMLGDTAVAVHPLDPRYTHLVGRYLLHPFVNRRVLVIADDQLVDMNFGTGAVKVTPAHDPNDYLCGKRHNLEFITVLNGDGSIASNGGEFAGMMRYDARLAMEAKLKELGLFRGKEANKMRLGLCSRSGDIIEPMLTPQWYVNCSSMAARSVQAVRDGSLKIVPEMHEATWYRWLENIRDWCISRQLWWGHRIPAYFVRLPGESEAQVDKNDPTNSARWFVGRSEQEARLKACEALGVAPELADTLSLTQDEDVLDTWFSSGLFPFSVFGWPEETDDFKAFFPTSLLETGLDILFFWVARMVMMSLHLTNRLPFTTVYLHAMVRDKNGRKMSKSLGNVIDPLEVIYGCQLQDLLLKIDEGNLPPKEVVKAKEAQKLDFPNGIPECGADALRFGLLAYTVQGRDVNLDIKRLVGYRQFCNKIWNAFRFACAYITEDSFLPSHDLLLLSSSSTSSSISSISKRDLFILSRLHTTLQEVNSAIGSYLFGAATTALHSFFLYDVCDTYLELLKPVFTAAAASDADQIARDRKSTAQLTLYTVLEQFLRLTHPLMPFVTEELWQRLPQRQLLWPEVSSIMLAPYPEPVPQWFNPLVEADFELLKEAIHGARSLRSDYRIPNHVKADFYFRSDSAVVLTCLNDDSIAQDFCTLARGNFLRFMAGDAAVPPGCCVKVLSDQLSLLVDLTGSIDIPTEINRLQKERERLTPLVDSYRRKMSAPGYEEKVPEAVRMVNKDNLVSYETELDAIKSALETFQRMLL
mmetsp:Transcript_12904/g.17693  ORF Transcript_12904/g.17693 Transcript_12904/m.17693 type:complete len:1013 (+) Transcript_12904:198-3236(+)